MLTVRALAYIIFYIATWGGFSEQVRMNVIRKRVCTLRTLNRPTRRTRRPSHSDGLHRNAEVDVQRVGVVLP